MAFRRMLPTLVLLRARSHCSLIKHLTEHVKANHKDFVTTRSLTKLVAKRRRLLDYLYDQDIERYRAIIKALGLRK